MCHIPGDTLNLYNYVWVWIIFKYATLGMMPQVSTINPPPPALGKLQPNSTSFKLTLGEERIVGTLYLQRSYCAFHKHTNSKVQKTPSQLRFSLPSIIITITSNEPWNRETHKTDRNPQITNHDLLNPWSKVLFPKRSVKMIDSSEKRNRRLAFELQNSHVCEKCSKFIYSLFILRWWIYEIKK